MKLRFLLLVSFITTILGVQAQNATSDTIYFSEISKNNYQLDADTLFTTAFCACNILKSNDPVKKSGFLSNFNTKLKSTFSENWKLDSIVASAWDIQSQTTKPSSWQVFKTVEDERLFEIRNYRMDEEQGHWIIDEARYFHFSADGLLDSVEFQTHVTLNYILFTKFVYTYENGRLKSEVIKERFDEFDWEYLNRLAYEYDTLGRLERVYTQEKDPFNENFWSSFEYVEYGYDSQNNLISETYFDYEDYDMISTKTSELLYNYDELNRVEKVVEYVKGWQAGTFVEGAKQEYLYDELSRLVQFVISHWDYDTNDWQGFKRYSQYFNLESDTLMVQETENWDNGWVLSDKAVFASPNSIQKKGIQSSEFVLSFLPVYEQDGLVAENISSLEWSGTNWMDRGETTYYFSPSDPVDVPMISNSSVRVYPNPVSDNLFVEFNNPANSEIRIHNLNGQLIFQKNLTETDLINVQTLSSGMYFIEVIQNGKKIDTVKIIKK